MATLHDHPGPSGGGEAARLTLHLRHCDLARGRWASVGNALDGLRSLLFGHIVSSAVVLTGLALGIAWLMG